MVGSSLKNGAGLRQANSSVRASGWFGLAASSTMSTSDCAIRLDVAAREGHPLHAPPADLVAADAFRGRELTVGERPYHYDSRGYAG
ncbi:hypothetical protein ACU639_36235 [Streptomyces cynarae]|uniref:hypothetical protein n=1 Tax=Streptomyces cynarae TaxID=2981134 RepID=UPI00406BF440